MNIINVLYTFNAGGVERLAIDVSNQIVKSGNKAYLCIISEDYSENLLKQLSEEVQLCLLKKEERNRKLAYLKQIITIIDKYEIDVMHVHQGTLMSFFFIVKCLRPKLRIYFTIHDTYIFSDLSKKDKYLSKLICNKFICISDAVVNDVKKYHVLEKKIVRIYNGVNFSRFQLINNEKLNNVTTIVNVARFFPEKKGQDLLIKAVGILKKRGFNVKVFFAGGEINETAKEIPRMKKLANQLKIEENVCFLGTVENVPELLQSADIFCIPSRYEGFGISAVEAMATGLPCVASNIIGLNEVVNDKKLGELLEAWWNTDLFYLHL